jgi:ATP-binding cassette subfamily F protein 3
LAKSFGPDDIFSNISLSVPRGGRVAIVGPNGVGKTTLLRILIGLDEPSAGSVQRAKKLEIGYLPQEARLAATHSLWEECLEAFEALRAQESELARLEAEMSDPERAQEALDRYGPLQEIFDRRGGYTYEARIRHTLSGLGFEPRDYHRPLSQLSGGQRTRALLARLLLSNPDLLVLDEPTNHLDIPAQETLQEALENFPGAILLVSHDRYLVDRLANQVWELKDGRLRVFKEGYQDYLNTSQLSGGSQAISEPETRNSTVEEPISQASRAPRNGSRPKSSYQRTRALTTLETSIHEQEAALERIRRELQSAGEAQSFNELQRLSWEFAEAQAHLEKLTAQWEELASLPISTG